MQKSKKNSLDVMCIVSTSSSYWYFIYGNCNIFATFRLQDAAVILVYLPLDVYIFYSSYTCNINTARCSSYTCLLTIGCIYFLLAIYLQHSDCRTARCSSYTCLLTIGCIYFLLPLDVYIFYSSYTCNIQTAPCSSYTCLLTIECIYFLLVIYSQHSDCTMQQLYLFTYHWIYIFSTCHIFAIFRLHDAAVVLVCLPLDVHIFYSSLTSTLRLRDAAVILVYLPLDVYIFYSSYIHNIQTAQCSSYTCLLTIGCIYFLLVIYLQNSDCTMQQLYLFTYHWMYIFSTCD